MIERVSQAHADLAQLQQQATAASDLRDTHQSIAHTLQMEQARARASLLQLQAQHAQQRAEGAKLAAELEQQHTNVREAQAAVLAACERQRGEQSVLQARVVALRVDVASLQVGQLCA